MIQCEILLTSNSKWSVVSIQHSVVSLGPMMVPLLELSHLTSNPLSRPFITCLFSICLSLFVTDYLHTNHSCSSLSRRFSLYPKCYTWSFLSLHAVLSVSIPFLSEHLDFYLNIPGFFPSECHFQFLHMKLEFKNLAIYHTAKIAHQRHEFLS